MEPIYLYPDIKEGYHVVTFGDSNELLSTPNGTVIQSKNAQLIENLVFDLQKYSEVSPQENNSIAGAPLEDISLYSLVCTEIDFWSDQNKTIELDEMIQSLAIDPIANIAPGPEQVDQIHQWRSVIKLLEENHIKFHNIQYFIEDRSEMEKLAKLVKEDFDKFTNSQRAAFIQLNYLLGAPICVWAFICRGLSQNALITALTQTAHFIVSVEDITKEKLEEIRPQDLTEDEAEEFDDEHYHQVERTARIEVYEEIAKVLSTVKEFLQISEQEKISNLLRDESISHEFKRLFVHHIGLPRSRDFKMKETFTMGNEKFLSKKQIQTFLQNIVLKTIASLLNTQGGQLVIGVHEFANKKNVIGIDREGFQSHDEYERHLVQIIKNAFTSSVVADFVTTKIQEIDNEHVCIVTCKKYEGDELIWFQDKLFIRTGPRIDELRGIEQAQFILQRQQNKSEIKSE